MNHATPVVKWLFLEVNAFFASCEQQGNPAQRGKPVIVVQALTESAVARAASLNPEPILRFDWWASLSPGLRAPGSGRALSPRLRGRSRLAFPPLG